MEWLVVIAVIWRLSIQTAEVISNYKIEMKKLDS